MEPWQELRSYVGAKDGDQPFLEDCCATATVLVTRFVGSSTVPTDVLDRAKLETAAALFQRRRALNNQASGYVEGSTPVFPARDPMSNVYPMLSRFVLPF